MLATAMLAVGVFAVANLERGTPVAITICVAAAHGRHGGPLGATAALTCPRGARLIMPASVVPLEREGPG